MPFFLPGMSPGATDRLWEDLASWYSGGTVVSMATDLRNKNGTLVKIIWGTGASLSLALHPPHKNEEAWIGPFHGEKGLHPFRLATIRALPPVPDSA